MKSAEPDLLLYEKEAWKSGFVRLAGVDEAGRGPLAGPVVAGAVFIDKALLTPSPADFLDGLTDSKILSKKKREKYFRRLKESPEIEIGLGIIDAQEIDRINILQATHRAMAKAVGELDPLPERVLVDGLPVAGLPCPSTAIVKGDRKSLSISAASIVAKVTRDRIMEELDRKYPSYGFASHKGYGTKDHLAAIKLHGPVSCHRKSFRPIKEFNQLDLGLPE